MQKEMLDVTAQEVAHLIPVCTTGAIVSHWDSDGKHMEPGAQKCWPEFPLELWMTDSLCHNHGVLLSYKHAT